MHKNVLAKIGLKKDINKEDLKFSYMDAWKKAEEEKLAEKDDKKERLKMQAWNLKRVPIFAKREIVEMVEGKKETRQDFIDTVHKYKKEIEKTWPEEIKNFVFQKIFVK